MFKFLDRDSALLEGQSELTRRGLRKAEGNYWTGILETAFVTLDIKVILPPSFPYDLPAIYIMREQLPRRIPHIEESGKICLPARQGMIIDVSRPASVLSDALAMTSRTIMNGLSGESDSDFIEEFMSYWGHNPFGIVHSICSNIGPSRPISLIHGKAQCNKSTQISLLADSEESGQNWMMKVGGICERIDRSYFLSLSSSFMPPEFGENLLTREFQSLIRDRLSQLDYDRLADFFKNNRLPLVVAFSMPSAKKEMGTIMAAALLEKPYGKRLKDSRKGFREANITAHREILFTSLQPVRRLAVHRYDVDYLLPRGGTILSMINKKVLVIGVGAIGSRLAEKLALIGVGHMHLIDKDILSEDNCHRHMLGFGYLGEPKAIAMQHYLERRFPHLDISSDNYDLMEELSGIDKLISSVDMICIAIGDETLELQLNRLLTSRIPRIHAWVEPLGIGGHVLVTGFKDIGCIECLYDRDEVLGLFNRSSFSAPGQVFARTFSGCTGVFTPFSGLHADRVAIEAAEQVTMVLNGRQSRSALISWFGQSHEFIQAGFRLSARAALFKPGEIRKEDSFASISCICSGWKS